MSQYQLRLQKEHTRIVKPREVTFTCGCCGETVTQWKYPARSYKYCSPKCQKEARRIYQRELMRKRRQKNKG